MKQSRKTGVWTGLIRGRRLGTWDVSEYCSHTPEGLLFLLLLDWGMAVTLVKHSALMVALRDVLEPSCRGRGGQLFLEEASGG